MAGTRKSGSHIREKVDYDDDTVSVTLDTYYKLHVAKPMPKPMPKPKPKPGFRSRNSQSEWLRRFQRTHYFGPNYWRGRQAAASPSQSRRLAELRRQIHEAKEVIEYKNKLDLHERWLKQVKASLAQQEADSKPTTEVVAAPQAQAQAQVETPFTPSPPQSPPPQPLVLMIGDEILYDEEYKWDPLWKQDEEEGYME